MTALSMFGSRQQQLLRALLLERSGMTLDALAQVLDISRNAVSQHISSLEASGLLAAGPLVNTGGRPSRAYVLTSAGMEVFPKHYALFSNLLIEWVQTKLGAEKLSSCMQQLGKQMANSLTGNVKRKRSLATKLTDAAAIMHELGYEARAGDDVQRKPEIIASNCVFQALAKDCEQVCHLDVSLVSTLVGKQVEHTECMLRGGDCCRFSVK